MRKETCPDCKGSGSQEYCKRHDSQPGLCCDCFSCLRCEGHGKLREKISNEELDKLTLKVSQVLHESGYFAHYNEDCNALRGHLFDFLTEWIGYELNREALWRHVDWIALRKKFGLPDPFKKE